MDTVKDIEFYGPAVRLGPGWRLKIEVNHNALFNIHDNNYYNTVKQNIAHWLNSLKVDRVSVFINFENTDDPDVLDCFFDLDYFMDIFHDLQVLDVWIYTNIDFIRLMNHSRFYWMARKAVTFVCGEYISRDAFFDGHSPVYRASFNQRIWQGKKLSPNQYSGVRYKDVTAELDPHYCEYIDFKSK